MSIIIKEVTQGDRNKANKPAVDGERLWDRPMQIAKIVATEKDGGCRPALTDLDQQGRDLFVGWRKQAGCLMIFDKVGTV